uniref:Uncharacterized protein n=1 Tax=Ignisphaera aggregans TaxID=334771 RepID=A0A7J2U1V1_9CREN
MVFLSVSQPLCTSCGKRGAVYKRFTSGEKLCRLCLFRSVAKQVRKTIHYYKMLKKNDAVLYILRGDGIILSVEAFAILHAAIKDLELVYNILCPSNIVNCNAVEITLKNITKDVVVNIVPVHYHLDVITKTFIHMLKYTEALAAKIALEHNLDGVLTPLFRDEMVLLSIYGLLTVSKTVFGESMPVKYIEGIKVVRPFYHVVSTDVIYLAITSALQELNSFYESSYKLFIGSDRFMAKAKEVLFRSPELMYSSARSVELMQSFITAGSTRCRICGSFSNREICEYCESYSRFL